MPIPMKLPNVNLENDSRLELTTNENPITLLEIEQKLIQLENEHTEKYNEFKKHVTKYNDMKKKLKEQQLLLNNNIDLIKFEHGKSLLKLMFPKYNNQVFNIAQTLIDDAKKDIALGTPYLSKQFIGQKRYEHFDQRCDCAYGYGPSHGYIYQRIGLKNPNYNMNDYDKECCLYFLSNLNYLVKNLNENKEYLI